MGLWTVDENNDDDATDGVFQFRPHTGPVPRLKFDPVDSNKLISTSYDGTVRRMDVEKGAFEQVNGGKRRFVSGSVGGAGDQRSLTFYPPPHFALMYRCSRTMPTKTLLYRTATLWQRTGCSC